MANIRKWLEEACAETGESIEGIVVGQHDGTRSDTPVNADENVLLPVDVALAKLDVEYDNGYGGADCFPIYAWTKTRVYFIGEYDGATGLDWIPRNPINIAPQFSGN